MDGRESGRHPKFLALPDHREADRIVRGGELFMAIGSFPKNGLRNLNDLSAFPLFGRFCVLRSKG
jgi:hypothetical protein